MTNQTNVANNNTDNTNNANTNTNFGASAGAGCGANNAQFANTQNMGGFGNMGYGMGAGCGMGGFGGAGGAGFGACGAFNPYFASIPQPQNPYMSQANAAQGGILATLTTQKGEILKGAAIGAVAAFILTNPTTQNAIFKGIAKLSSLLEMGVEELKERYEDAKAEVNEI